MMKEVKDAMNVLNIHTDCDVESFTTNLATIFGDEETENIAGAVIGVAYKDGVTKTLTYIAENENAHIVFQSIYTNLASGLKKMFEVTKE